MSGVGGGAATVWPIAVAVGAGLGAYASMLAVDVAFDAGRALWASARGRPVRGHVGVHRLEGVTRRIVVVRH